MKLPEGWREVTLGEICEIVSGSTPSTLKREYWNGNINWITPAEIESGHNWYYYETKKKITKEGLASCSINLFPKRTVMLTSRAPIGKVAIAGTEMCSNQGFKNFICDSENIIPEYLYFWLRSKEEYLNYLGHGATFKEVSKSVVSKIKIPLPPLATQQKIVSILEKAEETKQWRKEADELTKEFLKAVFTEMFGDLANNDQGFVLDKMENICSKITDGTHDTPQRHKKGVLFITGKNIRPFGLDMANIEYVSQEDHKIIFERCNAEFGDILYTNIGANVGTATRNPLNYEFSMKNVALLKPDKSKIDSYYLEHLLNDFNVKRKILDSNSVGGAQQFLSLKMIRNIEISIPPIALQNKFASIGGKAELMKSHQEYSKEQIDTLFNALLQKAFTGELVA